jgi:hypothetical protein
MFRASSVASLLWLFGPLGVVHAQLQPPAASDAIRVTVSQNDDGTRTAYEVDPANKKALSTITNAAGKQLQQIRYRLDEAGRFATGEVFGPDNQLRFKTIYRYDANGRLLDETQLTKNDVVKLKLVYAYDSTGNPNGYAVYDAAGKLLGQTTKKR